MDFPAHNLAAVQVEDEVQVEEDALGRTRQPGHISTPHLIRAGGTVRVEWPGGRCLTAAPVLLLALFTEHTIERGLRGDKAPFIRQGRYNLAGWQAFVCWAIHGGQHRLAPAGNLLDVQPPLLTTIFRQPFFIQGRSLNDHS